MAKPAWRHLVEVPVDAASSAVWTLAVDYVDSGRLLRITVTKVPAPTPEGEPAAPEGTVQQIWKLSPTEEINADGLPVMAPRTPLLLSTAPRGALIGKIGGSSADVPAATDADAVDPHTKLFAAGSYCVIEVGAKGGPLFLTMNDDLGNFIQHQGALRVTVEES